MIQLNDRRTPCVAAAFAAGLAIAWYLGTALHATGDPADTSSFLKKMQQWEDEMTQSFRDTFRNLREENKENSIGSASVDLREQPEKYIIRLNLPSRDLSKVNCSLEGDSLHIVAPAEDKVDRYEQSIVLADAARDAALNITRNQKDGIVVITVPKGAPLAGSGMPSPELAPWSDWDRQMFDEMQKMQREMDSAINDSAGSYTNEPGFKGFFDQPRFGSSIDLQEANGSYVVKAYLPNRDMQNVSVTATNDTLKIDAKAQDKKDDGSNGPNVIHEAEYSQAVTLPGPVDAGKMKVDKKEGMLIITLPKADSK